MKHIVCNLYVQLVFFVIGVFDIYMFNASCMCCTPKMKWVFLACGIALVGMSVFTVASSFLNRMNGNDKKRAVGE